ncbi:MAG: hypothetical protein M1820_000061 [Bogoriella megaspora]|nr:MAG: hypothetical protein M1820_000061 [Bogoriella megaspora]
MAAGGQLVGYVLGALNLQQIFGDLLGNTQFKQVVFIAGLALVLSICVTSWAVTEKVLLSPEISEKGQRDSPTAMLMQIVRTTLNLPARMRAICWIQFWSWVGWFPFLFYSTTWVGEIYLRYHAKTSGKVSEDHLAEIGRVGSTSLVVFSSIMMCGSLLLPFLVETPEENVLLMPRSPSAPPSPGLNARRKPTLLTAWIWSSLLFGVTLMVTPLVSTIRTAAFIVAVCGLPWTFASWAPFTFMGVEINRLSADPIPLTVDRSSERLSITMIDSQDEVVAKRVSLLGDDKAAQEEMAGIYLGILNLFTTLPQFVGTFISMIVFRLLEPGKSPELTEDPHNRHPPENGVNAIAVCMFIGGICSLIASHLTRKLRRMR